MTVRSLTSKRLEFASADEAIESYLERGWTDGLPVVPPTPVRVGDFLEYSGRPPSEIIGAEPTKGRVITAEKVAINAVMAGCLPEYGPVVLAAVEALCEPSFNLHAITVSTAGAAVLVAVNGPAASETGLNSGVSLFGPGHRANAAIGRAVRLVIGNVTGAAPGVLDKATLGHAGKYTWCIAEAEETSPWEPLHVEPWEPLHVERGLPADQGAVTVFAGLSPIQVSNGESDRPEEILDSFTDAMFAAGPEQARDCRGPVPGARFQLRIRVFVLLSAYYPFKCMTLAQPGGRLEPPEQENLAKSGVCTTFSAYIPHHHHGAAPTEGRARGG